MSSILTRGRSFAFLVALGTVLVGGATRAAASSLQITACQCLLHTNDPAQVTLEASNTSNEPLGLILAMQLPSGTWFYFRPIGLTQTPGSWVTIDAGASLARLAVVNTTATSANLPFGAFPIVGPFRYIFAAGLYSLTTGQPVVPYSR